jgi:tRNA nucleotidyltransferase/poly(A) polymerase
LQPPFDEQVGDVQKRGAELHKKLAVLKERLKEKQEKLLLQGDSEMVFAEDQSCSTLSVLPKPLSSPLELSMEVVVGKGTDESQNVSNNAELKDSNVSSRFQSISSLRRRQQQLRQAIELNNLKNIASKQKSLLSEQKIRLKESIQLLDECSTEVKRYEGLVEDGGKRIADLDRRQRLLLGMLTKATKSVLDARRAFKEAAENLKRSAE